MNKKKNWFIKETLSVMNVIMQYFVLMKNLFVTNEMKNDAKIE